MTDNLAASYAYCRAVHRAYGRTYYLATRLLPRWKRRHVHALYGFTRHIDEIVDAFDGADPAERAARLRRWTDRFTAALDGGPVGDDPVLPAVRHTIALFDLDRADFTAFLRSMAMDLTVTEYPTYDDLLDYMAGSAAAIGSLMLPILGARDLDRAREPARQLGLAFQLTNFIRDVGEDLARGRVYLPLKDLADHGVTRDDLVRACGPASGPAGWPANQSAGWPASGPVGRPASGPANGPAGAVTGPVRELIAFEAGRARDHYARAAPGIPLLDPSSRACIHAAYRLYGAILDEVSRAGYDVFRRRATVPRRRRLAIIAATLATPPGRVR